ncbi:hypothetical protein ACCO45_011792 [Purpureocillium lilacinum]|uniref:Uncharacterized protein n=1 Tax=Purpureocillium lilacinum TaxID=33203 RepID=A0ACC4DBV1_PURLI
MQPLGEPPPGTDLSANRHALIVALLASSWALAVIVTVLRVICRRLTRNRLWLDDWLILISLVWSAMYMFLHTVWCLHGFGKHIWAAPPEARKVYAQGSFLSGIAFILALVFIKLSVLALFWRLFSVQDSIQAILWILFGVVYAWGFAGLLVVIFQCLPTRSIWERFDPVNPMPPTDYSCGVDLFKFYFGYAVVNTSTDIVIVLTPFPYIWKLHLPRAQKAAVMAIFALGTLLLGEVIISGVRIVFLVTLDRSYVDVTWDLAIPAVMTGIEVTLGTLCQFVGGEGGTGKSHVIAVLMGPFAARGTSNRLLMTATSGMAAARTSGITIRSAYGFTKDHGSSRTNASKDVGRLSLPNQAEQRFVNGQTRVDWQEKDVLVIDEVSILGARTLHAVIEQLCRLRGSQRDLGSIPIVLFAAASTNSDRAAVSWDIDNSFKAGQRHRHDKAHVLWRRFATIIMPKEHMRAAGNPELQRLLKRIRRGEQDGTDLALPNSRCYQESVWQAVRQAV